MVAMACATRFGAMHAVALPSSGSSAIHGLHDRDLADALRVLNRHGAAALAMPAADAREMAAAAPGFLEVLAVQAAGWRCSAGCGGMAPDAPTSRLAGCCRSSRGRGDVAGPGKAAVVAALRQVATPRIWSPTAAPDAGRSCVSDRLRTNDLGL